MRGGDSGSPRRCQGKGLLEWSIEAGKALAPLQPDGKRRPVACLLSNDAQVGKLVGDLAELVGQIASIGVPEQLCRLRGVVWITAETRV